MAGPVVNFTARRRRAVTLTAIAGVLMTAWLTARALALHETAELSGWILFGTVLFLAGYNGRKKLTYPPLLKSSTWLQLHIYIGFLAVLLFVLHTGPHLPNGPLEATLAGLFVMVAASGIVGLVLTRTLPRRLTVRGEEVLFERIPMLRRELRDRAERLVISCAEETHRTTLADFYTRRLAGFLAGPRHFRGHLLQSSRPLRRMLDELGSLKRYLNEQERRAVVELAGIVEAKDGLDYHHAVQALLKGWLFVHIPLTFAMLILGAAHGVIALAFQAGIP